MCGQPACYRRGRCVGSLLAVLPVAVCSLVPESLKTRAYCFQKPPYSYLFQLLQCMSAVSLLRR